MSAVDLFHLGAGTFVSSTSTLARRANGRTDFGPDPMRLNAPTVEHGRMRAEYAWMQSNPGQQINYAWTQPYEGSNEWITVVAVALDTSAHPMWCGTWTTVRCCPTSCTMGVLRRCRGRRRWSTGRLRTVRRVCPLATWKKCTVRTQRLGPSGAESKNGTR